MNKIRFITSLLILCFAIQVLPAQVKPDRKHGKISPTEQIENLNHVIDSLKKACTQKDSTIYLAQVCTDSLLKKINNDSILIHVVHRHKIDSLQYIIKTKVDSIEYFKTNIDHIDSACIRLANRWLYEKFNKDAVDDAIVYFKRIYSKELKKDLNELLEVLCTYEDSYREFQTIIKDAQNDSDKDFFWEINNYKDKYKSRIQRMTYYLRFYDGDWSVRYLDDQIRMALKILEKHSENYKADFTPLIDVNFK